MKQIKIKNLNSIEKMLEALLENGYTVTIEPVTNENENITQYNLIIHDDCEGNIETSNLDLEDYAKKYNGNTITTGPLEDAKKYNGNTIITTGTAPSDKYKIYY